MLVELEDELMNISEWREVYVDVAPSTWHSTVVPAAT